MIAVATKTPLVTICTAARAGEVHQLAKMSKRIWPSFRADISVLSYGRQYCRCYIASDSDKGIKRTVAERGHISDAATSTPELAIHHSSEVIVWPTLQGGS